MVQTDGIRSGSTSGNTTRDRTGERAHEYTVKRGDTLSDIAKDRGLNLDDVIAANPQIRDPNKIYPGQAITLPQARAVTPSTAPDEVAGVSGPTRRQPSTGPIQPRNGALSTDALRASIESRGDGLARGARGPEVTAVQQRLSELGYNPGPADGVFGRRTQAAVQDFQRANSLVPDGIVGRDTRAKLDDPNTPRRTDSPVGTTSPDGTAPRLQRYEPGSPEAIALFREAARVAGVPESWAESQGLHNILRRESNGRVGVPNYTYGERARDPSQWGSVHDELRAGRITARSSATGLGQLLLSNVDRYYPNGRAGIGDPVQEAAGMLRYIQDRYGNPDNAWRQYGVHHEGY